MTGFRIPKTLAETGLTGRSEFDWAPASHNKGEAVYIGTIETVRINTVNVSDEGGPKFVLKPGESEAEVSSIQIGSIEPAEEGLESPGNQKFFDDLILLRVDDQSFNEELPETVNGRLKYAQYHLGNLAHALQLTDEVIDSGETFVVPVENFEDLYRTTMTDPDTRQLSGLAGERVMFKIARNEYKKRDGTPGLRYELKGFMQVV